MIERIAIALAFTLVASPSLAQQPVATEQSKVAVKPDRKICKRSAPSGSLIETRRECHTRAEWDQIAQIARAQGQDLIERAAATGQ